ncbi:hypothetical protein LZ30DRAFT_778517 [Colletotrichum cereale]|nr:hypothetical protein LZ30DRAFT_778517 [Colletotrichum cereale]
MHLRSFLAVGLAAATGVHSLRLGLSGVALSTGIQAFILGRATLAVSDVTADGLEKRQGEDPKLCMSIDPSECMMAKRDEVTDAMLDLAGLSEDDDDDGDGEDD